MKVDFKTKISRTISTGMYGLRITSERFCYGLFCYSRVSPSTSSSNINFPPNKLLKGYYEEIFARFGRIYYRPFQSGQPKAWRFKWFPWHTFQILVSTGKTMSIQRLILEDETDNKIHMRLKNYNCDCQLY